MQQQLHIRTLLVLLALYCVSEFCYAQPQNTDSLLKKLNTSKVDTGKVSLLLKIALIYVFKPGEEKSDLDSGILFARQAETLSKSLHDYKGEGNTYVALSQAFRERGDTTIGFGYVEKAIVILNTPSTKWELAEALKERIRYYAPWPKDNDKKIQVEEQIVKLLRETSDKQNYASELVFLVDLKGDESSIPLLLEALNIYKSIGYKNLQGVYDLLGETYSRQGDYKEALPYTLLAVKTVEERNDTSMQICTVYNRAGLLYFNMEQYDKAVEYFKKSLQVAKKYKDGDVVQMVGLSLSNALVHLDQPRQSLQELNEIVQDYPIASDDYETMVRLNACYVWTWIALKDLSTAERYYQKMMLNADKIIKYSWYRRAQYRSSISLFLAKKQYDLVRRNLEAYDDFCNFRGLRSEFADNQLTWFRVDSARGNYLSAINHLSLFHKMRDSLFDETKSRQIAYTQIQFETAKKEDSIKLAEQNIGLLNQRTLLQQQEINHTKFTRNGIIAGSLLLLLLVVVLYNRYRLKKRNNDLLMTQQAEITKKNNALQHLLDEKEWLLKEVHHRVKNNLHTILCLLKSQAAYLENDALAAIENSQHRIYAMSLIHQKLYQSEEVKAIDMSLFLPEFIQYLNDSLGTKGQIHFRHEIDTLQLGITEAIPLALIVNEAITNSMKYAFPDKRAGTIEINMHIFDDSAMLVIADNGIGFDTAITHQSSGSLGLELMKGLSDDINARIIFENDHGTRITIVFTPNQMAGTMHYSTFTNDEAVVV